MVYTNRKINVNLSLLLIIILSNMNVWMKLKRLFLVKYLNILSLNISVPWKVLPAYILLSNVLVILYIACYKAMLKKASISRHQLGKYTQREKEKNFYLDQSRKQDIEYPWKKSITAQLFMPSLH